MYFIFGEQLAIASDDFEDAQALTKGHSSDESINFAHLRTIYCMLPATMIARTIENSWIHDSWRRTVRSG